MKILFISDVFFPRVNGVSTSIQTFKEDLKKLGHTVHLICPSYHDEKKINTISRVKSKSIFFDPEDHLMSWFELRKLTPWIKKQNFDIIHSHTPFISHFYAKRLSRLLKVPLIETYHTSFEDYLHLYIPFLPEKIARFLSRNIAKFICNHCDGIVSPSSQMKEILLTYKINKPIEIIPTGLHEKSFTQKDKYFFRNINGIDQNDNLLLFVGRVAHEKNIDFLLYSFKEIIKHKDNTKFLITGEGPALDHIKNLIKQLGLQKNVILTGYLDPDYELLNCYASADLFIFASKTETQGLVLIEAMAQGLPIVALAENGTKSILINNPGAIISSDNYELFAKDCIRLLENKKQLTLMSNNGKAEAQKKWTSMIQAEKLLSFYSSIIDDYQNCRLTKNVIKA
ncbi:MAG: glycosyltransferase [Methylophilaceae bacterium]